MITLEEPQNPVLIAKALELIKPLETNNISRISSLSGLSKEDVLELELKVRLRFLYQEFVEKLAAKASRDFITDKWYVIRNKEYERYIERLQKYVTR